MGPIYCKDCGTAFQLMGMFPLTCPTCLKPAVWTTTAPSGSTPEPDIFTDEDRRFLRAMKIGADAMKAEA